jgi:hypothetical protein
VVATRKFQLTTISCSTHTEKRERERVARKKSINIPKKWTTERFLKTQTNIAQVPNRSLLANPIPAKDVLIRKFVLLLLKALTQT